MLLLYDIQGERYEKLLQYAMDNSDAVMIVYCASPPRVETAENRMASVLAISPSFEVTEEIFARWRAMEQEDQNDMVLFEHVRQPFIESLSPFFIKKREAHEWPSTIIGSSNSTYIAAVYRICEGIIPLLLQPGSYFSWRYPRYPEDLSFFKDNRCWLYASSHEGYIEFLPRSQEEYDFVASLGIELPEPYRPIDDSEYYWEEYRL